MGWIELRLREVLRGRVAGALAVVALAASATWLALGGRSTAEEAPARGAEEARAAESGAALLATAAAAPAMVHNLKTTKKEKHPWGWICWLMNADVDPKAEMTLGIVQIDAGQSNPLHVHATCDEMLYVLSGGCEHRIGDEWVALRPGDAVRIPAGTVHAARTSAEEPMRAVVVYNKGRRDFRVVEE